ncbi:MAG: hypothetical protein GY679_01130, partial [Mycoplasma sp.]|nr:hypothetical protein [Mycoplasma sp.]
PYPFTTIVFEFAFTHSCINYNTLYNEINIIKNSVIKEFLFIKMFYR